MLRLLQEMWQHRQNPPLKLTIWSGDWRLSAASEPGAAEGRTCNSSRSSIYVKLFSDDMIACYVVGKYQTAHELNLPSLFCLYESAH